MNEHPYLSGCFCLNVPVNDHTAFYYPPTVFPTLKCKLLYNWPHPIPSYFKRYRPVATNGLSQHPFDDPRRFDSHPRISKQILHKSERWINLFMKPALWIGWLAHIQFRRFPLLCPNFSLNFRGIVYCVHRLHTLKTVR